MSTRTILLGLLGIVFLTACNFAPYSEVSDAGDGHDASGIDGGAQDATLASKSELISLAFLATNNTSLDVDVAATITGTTVKVLIPFSTDRSALVATFTIEGARAEVMGIEQVSGTTPNDLSLPLVYRVIAEDESATEYTVVVIRQLSQRAYVKASNTGESDRFGGSIAISADGSTLAVGAVGEDSRAVGVGGDQSDNSRSSQGAVYVFVRVGGTWQQQAYIKPPLTFQLVETGIAFGASVALSAEGNILAVGSPLDTSCPDFPPSPSCAGGGAVYVFARASTTWTHLTSLRATNPSEGDGFGWNVALSAAGTTLAVGAVGEDSAAIGIGGNQLDGTQADSGAIYIFTRTAAFWSPEAYIKASNTGSGDRFGSGVALSDDGMTLAVGAAGEDSAATGVDGDQTSNASTGSGAVYLFIRAGSTWTQQAYLKASNPGAQDFLSSGDSFGARVALSADGNILAVGAPGEDSAATGINGDQTDNSKRDSGAAYLFTRAGITWSQVAYVKASTVFANENFGSGLSLSGDGSTLAVGADRESSGATGVNATTNAVAIESGAIYLFTSAAEIWNQHSYVKASNTDRWDNFGWSVALAFTGGTLAVAAPGEDGASTGIDGDQADRTASSSGAVYLFR